MMTAQSGIAVGLVIAVVGLALGAGLPAIAARLLRPPRPIPIAMRIAAPLVTAGLFGMVALRFTAPLEVAAYLLLAASAVLLALVDILDRRLPNLVVLPAAVVLLTLLLGAALAANSWPAATGTLLGAAGLFAVYLLLAVISPSGMGMGDVKLAIALGAASGYLGLTAWLLCLTAGFLVGALAALGGLATRRVGLRGQLPFGPSMLLGAFIAILAF